MYGCEPDTENLVKSFEKNARYASRCISYEEDVHYVYLFYRVVEQGYNESLHRMIGELQQMAQQEFSTYYFSV